MEMPIADRLAGGGYHGVRVKCWASYRRNKQGMTQFMPQKTGSGQKSVKGKWVRKRKQGGKLLESLANRAHQASPDPKTRPDSLGVEISFAVSLCAPGCRWRSLGLFPSETGSAHGKEGGERRMVVRLDQLVTCCSRLTILRLLGLSLDPHCFLRPAAV